MRRRGHDLDMLLECDSFSTVLLRKQSVRSLSEWQIIRAYVRLVHARLDDRGVRHVVLARFGAYEVRLFERLGDDSPDPCPVWLELFDHDLRGTVESCGCCEFDEAVVAGDELLRLARELNRQARRH